MDKDSRHISSRDAGPAYAHYNSKERGKIVMLQRRAAWLRQRLDGGEDFTYDKQELSALEWVLGRLANMDHEHTD